MSPYRVTRSMDAARGITGTWTCHQSRWLDQVRKIERFLCSLRAALFLRQVLLRKQKKVARPRGRNIHLNVIKIMIETQKVEALFKMLADKATAYVFVI